MISERSRSRCTGVSGVHVYRAFVYTCTVVHVCSCTGVQVYSCAGVLVYMGKAMPLFGLIFSRIVPLRRYTAAG